MPAVRRAALQRALEGASGADRRQGIEALRLERSGIGESGFGWMALGARFKCGRALRRFDLNARDSAMRFRIGGRRGALGARFKCCKALRRFDSNARDSATAVSSGRLPGRASNAARHCGASIRTLGIRRKRFRMEGRRGALQMRQGIEALRLERSGFGDSGFGWKAVGARFECCKSLKRFDSNARESAKAVSGGRSRGAL